MLTPSMLYADAKWICNSNFTLSWTAEIETGASLLRFLFILRTRLRDAITSLTFRSRLRDATTPLRAFSLMTGIEMTCFLELFFNAYIYISRCLFKGFQKCTEVYRHRFWSTEVDFGRPRSTMKKRRFFRRFFTFLDIFSRSTFFVYGRCNTRWTWNKERRTWT